MKLKQLLIGSALLAGFASFSFAGPVDVQPIRGPIGVERIQPPTSSTVTYTTPSFTRSITFQNITDIELYISTYNVASTTAGFPLLTKGAAITLEIPGGKTFWIFGNGASGEGRALYIKDR
jgi:hypothetical protein